MQAVDCHNPADAVAYNEQCPKRLLHMLRSPVIFYAMHPLQEHLMQ